MKRVLVSTSATLLTLALMAGTAAAQTIPTQQVTCASFASQAAAQAAYRANPAGLRSLDPDGDGIACEDNRAPFDRTPVRGTAPAAPDHTTRPSAQPTTRPGALPRTGGMPIEVLAALGVAVLGVGYSLKRFWR